MNDTMIPWAYDEMIHVAGYHLVYEIDPTRGMVVKLPGCRECHPEELHQLGGVRMPRFMRQPRERFE